MNLTTQWPSISAGARLVAPGTLLPPEWQVEKDSAANRWSRLTTTPDNTQFESQVASGGWTFFFHGYDYHGNGVRIQQAKDVGYSSGKTRGGSNTAEVQLR